MPNICNGYVHGADDPSVTLSDCGRCRR